jgi:putative toxin-antitoxin system antitoxin component (TIGR02293 family)
MIRHPILSSFFNRPSGIISRSGLACWGALAIHAGWQYNLCQMAKGDAVSATSEIVEALGGREDRSHPITSAEELKAWIRKGLPFRSLERVMERFGLNREEISLALDLPLRTLARRKQERRLHPSESDRLCRLVRIAAQASAVLGSEEKAGRWLHTANRALGGKPPLELLDTDLGSRQVEEVLGRIEHGVYS